MNLYLTKVFFKTYVCFEKIRKKFIRTPKKFCTGLDQYFAQGPKSPSLSIKNYIFT